MDDTYGIEKCSTNWGLDNRWNQLFKGGPTAIILTMLKSYSFSTCD